jgi:hypothetical protein
MSAANGLLREETLAAVLAAVPTDRFATAREIWTAMGYGALSSVTGNHLPELLRRGRIERIDGTGDANRTRAHTYRRIEQ